MNILFRTLTPKAAWSLSAIIKPIVKATAGSCWLMAAIDPQGSAKLSAVIRRKFGAAATHRGHDQENDGQDPCNCLARYHHP